VTALLVAIGAALGAPLRYLTDRLIQSRAGSRFPLGTLTVNVSGSLLLGVIAGLSAGPGWAALLGSGFCGTLTTYSTFSYEVLCLLQDGQRRRAALYLLSSIGFGLAAGALGYALATGSVR